MGFLIRRHPLHMQHTGTSIGFDLLPSQLLLTNWRRVAPLECLICSVCRFGFDFGAFLAVRDVGTSPSSSLHPIHLIQYSSCSDLCSPHRNHRQSRLHRYFELPFECRERVSKHKQSAKRPSHTHRSESWKNPQTPHSPLCKNANIVMKRIIKKSHT